MVLIDPGSSGLVLPVVSLVICGLEVYWNYAVLKWANSKQRDLSAASSGPSCCTLDDFTRHQQLGHGQLLIAGGHDVTWQSLRSALSLSCPSPLCCVRTQCMQQHNDIAHNMATPHASYTSFSKSRLVQRRYNNQGSIDM